MKTFLVVRSTFSMYLTIHRKQKGIDKHNYMQNMSNLKMHNKTYTLFFNIVHYRILIFQHCRIFTFQHFRIKENKGEMKNVLAISKILNSKYVEICCFSFSRCSNL